MFKDGKAVKAVWKSGIALGVLMLTSGIAQAQTQGAAPSANAGDAATDDDGLSVIIVQARKVSENMQQVPVAVTAYSGADLVKQNIQQVQDLGRFTPGLAQRQEPRTYGVSASFTF